MACLGGYNADLYYHVTSHVESKVLDMLSAVIGWERERAASAPDAAFSNLGGEHAGGKRGGGAMDQAISQSRKRACVVDVDDDANLFGVRSEPQELPVEESPYQKARRLMEITRSTAGASWGTRMR